MVGLVVEPRASSRDFFIRLLLCGATFTDTSYPLTVQWENAPNPMPVEADREQQPPTPPPALPSESEVDLDSEDDYVAEPETAKGKGIGPSKVCKPIFLRICR